MKQRRKILVYRTMGKIDFFEYYYDNVLKNQEQVNAFMKAHPDYECGSVQIIRQGPKASLKEYYTEVRTTPLTVSQILEACKLNKQVERDSKPTELKPESEYTYNREMAEEWLQTAKDNDWDLTVSIKPLCDHLGLAPVVVAPVLQRYGFIEKRKPVEKTYKYSKEQVQVWWDTKLHGGLTIQQLAEKIGVHFLQVGKAFTQHGFTPKKEKLSKKEKKELRESKKRAKK
jgi:hypothetical protein